MYPNRHKIIVRVVFWTISVLFMACEEEEPPECTDINGLSEQIGQIDVDGSFTCAAEVHVFYESYTANNLLQEQLTWAMTSRLSEKDECFDEICRDVSITLRTPFPNTLGIRLENFEGTLKELMDMGFEIDLVYETGGDLKKVLVVDPCFDAENLFVSFRFRNGFSIALDPRAEIIGEVGMLTPEGEERQVFWHTLAFRRINL